MTTTTGTRPAPTPSTPTSSTPTDAAAGGTVTALWSKLENPPVLWRPLASYYLLLASTALLVGFGVVMVWSSSYVESDQVSFAVVQKQLLWLSIGIPLMLVASRLPVSVFRYLAYPALFASCGLLVAVLIPGLGVSANGATRWVALGGPFTIQPSEFAKLGLVLWGADLLARKHKLGTLDSYRRILVPLLPISICVLALIEKEHDLGTMLVVLTIVLSLLWVVGAPLRLFVVTMLAVVGGVTYLAISEPYRLAATVEFRPPVQGLPRHRVAGVSGHLWPRRRRLVGRRAWQQPAKVGLLARGAHRLHLCHHRRGIGARRHDRCPDSLRRTGLLRHPGSTAQPRHVLPSRGVSDRCVAHGASPRQHRRGDRIASDHGHSVTADIGWWVVADTHHVRAGHFDVAGASRTERRGCDCRARSARVSTRTAEDCGRAASVPWRSVKSGACGARRRWYRRPC